MLRPRVIPCLLVHEGGLVKTVGFRNPKYVGDPINAVKIFNEKEADELKWIYDQLAAGGSLEDAVSRVAGVVGKIEATIPEESEVRLIFGAAADLELMLLILVRRTMAGQRSIPARLKTDNLQALPLPSDLRKRMDGLIAMLENPNSDPSACSTEIANLGELLAGIYAERKHEATPYAIRYTASLVGARQRSA